MDVNGDNMVIVTDVNGILGEQNPWWQTPLARPEQLPTTRRDAYDALQRAIAAPSNRRAVVLMGPRQVGKTTVMKQVLRSLLDEGWPPGNITFFDFADDRFGEAPDPRELLKQQPVSFRPDHPQVLFLDELQRYAGWGDWLRREVDRGLLRVFATGSSMSLLRQGGVETGQGRWDEFHMEALTFRETLRLHGGEGNEEDLLRERPQLFERFLKTGGMPEFALQEPSSQMRSRLRGDIASKAIMRDLRPYGVDVQRVTDLFLYLVRNSGAVFEASKRAVDMGANRKSVSDWVGLLKDTGLLVSLPLLLPPGGGKASKQLRPKPKIYAADHGLIDAFWPGQGSAMEALRARVYEAAVFRQLRQFAEDQGETRLSYLRTKREASEIDFVVELPGLRVGIEVTGAGGAEKWPKLLKEKEHAKLDRVLLVHGGATRAERDGLLELPLRSFLLDPEAAIKGDVS